MELDVVAVETPLVVNVMTSLSLCFPCSETRGLRCVPGAVAFRCVRLLRDEEEHGQRGAEGQRLVLRHVDPRPVHEASGSQSGEYLRESPP